MKKSTEKKFPPDYQEKDYVLTLVVRISGYGNSGHQRRVAGLVKRALELAVSKGVEVDIMLNRKIPSVVKLLPVTWKTEKGDVG
jgi:hypothetical protein